MHSKLFYVYLSVLFSGELAQAENKSKRIKPNILFIAVDDLNDWVGCLGGHPQAKTPNIDAFAKQGVYSKRHIVRRPYVVHLGLQ